MPNPDVVELAGAAARVATQPVDVETATSPVPGGLRPARAGDNRVTGPAAAAGRRRRGLSRRGFLRLCGGGVLGLGASAAYARFGELHWLATETLEMDFPALAPGWDGLRLIQISDLHISEVVSTEFLRSAMKQCTALAPDVIVITGDFITRCDLRFLPELRQLMSCLRAPLGVFAVLGNHDFGLYDPLRKLGVPARNLLEQPLAEYGVTVLRNNRVLVESPGRAGGLQLVGLDDWWSGLADPEAAFANVDPAQPCILLTHNPDTVALVRARPWHWLLCGHTHGGQIRIPLLGAPVLPIEDRRFDQGLFKLNAQQRVYVNRGVGHLLPVRFNCRPEITVFTLRRAQNSA